MKVAVAYPPITKDGQYPLLSQNRHLKFSHSSEVRIFPLVPAHAATNLKKKGHEVLWIDGINERMNMTDYQDRITEFQPALIMLETKAPVVKTHWKFIEADKKKNPDFIYVLTGDHVSYFPQESLENSPVDYVITGGDYDVTLTQLVEYLEGRADMPAGVWYRDEKNAIRNTGPHVFLQNLDELPFIDRELTRWKTYGEAYLLPDVAYMLTGRGCGLKPGRGSTCTFCIWQHAFWNRTARLRSPENVVAEIRHLVKLGAKEIFDDNETGPIYDRDWMKRFYQLMVQENLIGKVVLSVNARGDLIDTELAVLMKKCGYRLLKIGVEAGSDESLARIAKMEGIEKIKQGVKAVRDQGMVTLLTTMVGYPWETEEEVKRTYEVTRELMLYKPKFGDCLQASVVVPYPGSPLWKNAVQKKWFLVDPHDYDSFDMSIPLLSTSINREYWVKKLWKIHFHPWFILRSLFTIRSRAQLNLAYRGVISLLGHVRDYHVSYSQVELKGSQL